MIFKKTNTKVTCKKHGDTVLTYIYINNAAASGVPACCLQEAIDAYVDKNVCVDCKEPVPPGTGLEKAGILVKLCRSCTVKRLFPPTIIK